jgi:excisionase family DNA binding protein
MTATKNAGQSLRKAEVRFFTVGEIALQLNVSSRTVRRWAAERKLVVHRFGRSVRIFEADLKNFLAMHRDGD